MMTKVRGSDWGRGVVGMGENESEEVVRVVMEGMRRGCGRQ